MPRVKYLIDTRDTDVLNVMAAFNPFQAGDRIQAKGVGTVNDDKWFVLTEPAVSHVNGASESGWYCGTLRGYKTNPYAGLIYASEFKQIVAWRRPAPTTEETNTCA